MSAGPSVTTSRSDALDPEWEALMAGLKPALRVTVGPEHAAALVARFRDRHALGVARAVPDAVLDGRTSAVLYIARSAADAEALRALEAPILPGLRAASFDEDVARQRDIGLALGFPACCVEAYLTRIQDDDRGTVDDYAAARAAWVSRPDPLLNHLLLGTSWRLVTFFPCRYDCRPAAAYARALLDVLGARHGAAAADALAGVLAQDVVVAPWGERAIVARGPDGRIAHAASQRRSHADAVPTGDDAFARRLVGAAVAADGTVAGAEGPPLLCVPFGAAAPRCEDALG